MIIVRENCLFYWEGESQESSRPRGGKDDVSGHVDCLMKWWFSKGPGEKPICSYHDCNLGV